MKLKFFLGVFTILVFGSCNTNEDQTSDANKDQIEEVSYASFGDSISTEGAISGDELAKMYTTMNPQDTLEVKFTGVIENVCQKKGCWMNVKLSDSVSTFIRFKDYGFFMPFNAAESEAIINGKGFISVTSVDELKHYAEDEGLSQEEIDAITEPEIGFNFLADGVLIKE
jgi:hypothetical protein